eukprot:gene9737-13103_t
MLLLVRSFCLLLLLENIFANQAPQLIPVANLKPTNYQKWAHYHFVWLHNSESNQNNVSNLIKDYHSHNIPFGAVNIDSMWATQFNNFVVNTDKFPDFAGLVQEIHDQNAKVILWATSMVNVENPDYNMTVEKNYLIRDSFGIVRPLQWWHGYGGLLDYTNPEGLAWWHSQMDKVLDVGVDGFKCDGTDPYIMEYNLFGGAYGYENKKITYHEYASSYFRDFYYYTREKRSSDTGPDSGLIWSRPVDCLIDPVSKLCIPSSPRDVMMSGWVGDDDGTFNGFRGCMRKLIYSSWLNYANFGCDIGGYRSDGNDKILFIRWAQAMAFMPLMENGGGGDHRPWHFDDESVDIYRKYVLEHHKLAAYLHSNGANAFDQVKSSILPLDSTSFPYAQTEVPSEGLPFPQPTSYSYRLGSEILVHPVMYDTFNKSDVAFVEQEFPQHEADSEGTVWLDWWEPANFKRAHKSGEKSVIGLRLSDYSVYVRQGALIPLIQQAKPSEDKTDITNKRTTFTWFAPTHTTTSSIFEMRESITEGPGIRAIASFTSETSVVATLSAHNNPIGFEIIGIEEPTEVVLKSWPTSLCFHDYVKLTKKLSVLCKNNDGGLEVIVNGLILSQ